MKKESVISISANSSYFIRNKMKYIFALLILNLCFSLKIISLINRGERAIIIFSLVALFLLGCNALITISWYYHFSPAVKTIIFETPLKMINLNGNEFSIKSPIEIEIRETAIHAKDNDHIKLTVYKNAFGKEKYEEIKLLISKLELAQQKTATSEDEVS